MPGAKARFEKQGFAEYTTPRTDPVPVTIPVNADANHYTETGFPNEQIDFRDYALLADDRMLMKYWPVFSEAEAKTIQN